MADKDIQVFRENATGDFEEIDSIEASDAELDAGTERGTLVTPKGLKDAEFQRIHVGTSAPADTTKLWLDTN